MEEPSKLKENANVLFRNKLYSEAVEEYEKAAELADNELKAICYGNIGACYYHQDEYEPALDYSEKALDLNPGYTKVRERKIRILMAQGRVQDAKEELSKGDVSLELKNEVEQAAAKHFEKEKTEMLGKLKDLGNNILGKFGLSLDNFKMQKNENGGYNVNFQNN
jgi:tetratricopeptide (TPR) repeat protein